MQRYEVMVVLSVLATALDAAKSSVQELTNGLLARGYLVEDDGRFHLGPGPFILAARVNKLAALSIDHGFVVANADSAQKALDMARQLRPQLILLDVHLPDADGRELCSRMKCDPDFAGIPIVLISATLGAVTYNGKLYGMPLFNSAKNLFYNARLLQEAG